MLLCYPLVMLTLWKMLMLRNFLWYMDQKRNILMCLIIWAVLGRIYAERYLIFKCLLAEIQHPVFISLVRLSSGKQMKQHNSNNTSLTRTFIHMGDQPTNIDPSDIDIIAKYICNCYGLDTSSGNSFEALCLHQLLNTPNICLWTLAPSVPAIEQHVRHACIQAGYLWKLSHLELDLPDPTSWGWKLSSVSTFSYIPLWQACSLPELVHALKDHVTTVLAKKAELTVWSFASMKNQNVKINFALRTRRI